MKGDMKAAIIAEYERTNASFEQVRKAVGSDSYEYVSYVLRTHRGECDPRSKMVTLEAHNEHLMSISGANAGRGFPALQLPPSYRVRA